MTVCVCGCPGSAHIPTLMSVPLVGVGHYPPPSPPQIAKTDEGATYEQMVCGCGCASWEPDVECA